MSKTESVKCKSLYLNMRDGVRIAVDLYLPREALKGGKIPLLLHQTRYQRSVDFRKPYNLVFKNWFADVLLESREFFVRNGYAWMDVDARGSGASFGKRPCPWSPDETRDGADITDWIIAQPWSNGKVGATGISYSGTTSDMLLVNRHPAVKAIIPQFSLFDAYTDVAFPGGMHQFYFTQRWNRMNAGFDRNDPEEVIGMWSEVMLRGIMEKKIDEKTLLAIIPRAAGRGMLRFVGELVRGVRPTDEDADYSIVKQAVAAHSENFNVHEAAQHITFRDDGVISPLVAHLGPTSIDFFSPHTYVKDIDASGAAVFSFGGWWDMAYQHAAIKRHATLTNPDNRLMIGAWDHAGRHDIGPTVGFKKTSFDRNAEFLQFFDYHLKGKDTGMDRVAPVRYYTMGEEKWKNADAWPPKAQTLRLYLAPRRRLDFSRPADADAVDRYRVDYDAGSGELSRWASGVGISIDYSDRRQRDKKLLVYDSAPLDRDMEVTGHPVLTLFVESTADDGNFIAYLEEVTPRGEVRYVTEGNLRAMHRKVSRKKPPYKLFVPYHTFKKEDAMPLVPGEVGEITFDLLPTSYLFRKHNKIRIAIAGADRHHYINPPGALPTIHVHRTKAHPSHIALPVVEDE